MLCKFIELTDKDNSKFLINTMHISWIEPNKDGSTIWGNWVNHSFPKKVKETYDQIKVIIDKDNFSS